MMLLITLLFTSLSFLTSIPHGSAAAEGFLTGSKTLEITDYSIVKKGIISGNYIQSDTFTVGGEQWTIEFYPQSWNSSSSDFVSIMVRLINPKNTVRAMFTHRLQDWTTSLWSTDTPASSSVETFSSSGNTGWGYYNFIKRSNLETSNYLRNDTLVIKTALWVVKGSSTVLQSPLSTTVSDISIDGNSNGQNFMTADVSLDNSKNQADA